jgi:hypothetical protein
MKSFSVYCFLDSFGMWLLLHGSLTVLFSCLMELKLLCVLLKKHSIVTSSPRRPVNKSLPLQLNEAQVLCVFLEKLILRPLAMRYTTKEAFSLHFSLHAPGICFYSLFLPWQLSCMLCCIELHDSLSLLCFRVASLLCSVVSWKLFLCYTQQLCYHQCGRLSCLSCYAILTEKKAPCTRVVKKYADRILMLWPMAQSVLLVRHVIISYIHFHNLRNMTPWVIYV